MPRHFISATTLGITTPSIRTTSITTFSITLRKCDTQHNDFFFLCCVLLCWMPFMLSVTIMSFMLNVVMLSGIMLNVMSLISSFCIIYLIPHKGSPNLAPTRLPDLVKVPYWIILMSIPILSNQWHHGIQNYNKMWLMMLDAYAECHLYSVLQ